MRWFNSAPPALIKLRIDFPPCGPDSVSSRFSCPVIFMSNTTDASSAVRKPREKEVTITCNRAKRILSGNLKEASNQGLWRKIINIFSPTKAAEISAKREVLEAIFKNIYPESSNNAQRNDSTASKAKKSYDTAKHGLLGLDRLANASKLKQMGFFGMQTGQDTSRDGKKVTHSAVFSFAGKRISRNSYAQ